MQETIVLTGGAGYIGSHTAWILHQQGYHVVIIDSLVHHQPWPHTWATLIVGDYADTSILETVFSNYQVSAVMHFAAYIEVGASVTDPERYYDNNVAKTLTLLSAMRSHQITRLIFSSSCAVYGTPQYLPLTEDHPKNPISPYGTTKLMVELILQDYAHAYNLQFVALRYFNAAGALPSAGLGEHHEPESHLIPLVLRSALTQKPFTVFGLDHATPDGTCIRDYLHVLDIAQAHYQALRYLNATNAFVCLNLGTGTGTSVQNIIAMVEHVTGTTVPVVYSTKRAGDPAMLIANAERARHMLGWHPQQSDLQTIITSAYDFAVQQTDVHNSAHHAAHHHKQPRT